MILRSTVAYTIYFMTALLPEKGIASPAVEEFYAALYDEVANKTDDVHTLPKNAIENYLPTLETQYEAAVHLLAKTPEHLIEQSNFLIDVANTLNVPTFDGIDFSTYPALDTAIRISEENLCSPISCDSTSQWRSVDGTCNNLNNPRWGAANEAQNRIIPAEWEEGALIPFTLEPGIEAIDATSHGVKVTNNDHVIFIVYGNIPLKLRFDGTDALMVITLQPNFETAASTIKINGKTVGKTTEQLYDRKTKSYLWVRWADIGGEFIVSLGRDSECEETNAILVVPNPPVSFDRLYLEAGDPLSTGAKQYLKASFYIRSNYEVETWADNAIDLENIPWIYQNHKSFVFGIQRPTGAGSFSILLTGTNEESSLSSSAELDIGSADGMASKLKICIKSTCNVYTIQHVNVFTAGTGFDYFWLSWMGRSVHFGSGQIDGKNAFDFYANVEHRRLFSETFTVTSVQLKSTVVIRWSFDIKQINVPRKTSRCGRPLPSPRSVSLAVHCRTGATKLSGRLTKMTFQVGQHVDHDIIGTPLQTSNGVPITCAENNIPYPPDKQNRHCFNIIVSNFKNEDGDQGSHPQAIVRALNFVRSGVMIDCDDSLQPRDLRVRNPINVLTSFIDASNLYTNRDADLNEIRAKAAGDADLHTSQYMELDDRNELPTTDHVGLETPCNNAHDPTKLCRKSGDFRSNEHSGLNSIHTIWAREHNRIARELTTVHNLPETTAEDREFIFQYTRRFLIAEMQEIVYGGYLKSYMDPNIGDKFGLGIGAPDKKCSYNDSIDPTVFNCFGILYRMGHSMITEILRAEDPDSGLEEIKLKDNFFNPGPSHQDQGTDSILKYFAHAACPHTDSTLERVATEELFRVLEMASDLAALNIQRGRDHGCPSYCALREYYGLYIPKSWDDAVDKHLISQETVDSLRRVYDSVCDIDPFTAAVSEMALINRPDYDSTSLIGELVNYLMADTFGRLRCGDRFWYEFDAAGFTDVQKQELSKATLARVMCDNIPSITEIQRDVFMLPNLTDENGVNTNEVVDCSQIPSVDLSLFT